MLALLPVFKSHRCIDPGAPPPQSTLPSGPNATLTTPLPVVILSSCLPVVASHRRTVWSRQLPDNTRLPSGESAAALMRSVWPSKIRSFLAVSVSHNCNVLSSVPLVSRRLPSADKDRIPSLEPVKHICSP